MPKKKYLVKLSAEERQGENSWRLFPLAFLAVLFFVRAIIN